jgi:hypothetical protein
VLAGARECRKLEEDVGRGGELQLRFSFLGRDGIACCNEQSGGRDVGMASAGETVLGTSEGVRDGSGYGNRGARLRTKNSHCLVGSGRRCGRAPKSKAVDEKNIAVASN